MVGWMYDDWVATSKINNLSTIITIYKCEPVIRVHVVPRRIQYHKKTKQKKKGSTSRILGVQ